MSTRREIAERMADAARTWLESLDNDQLEMARGAVPSDDPSDDERRRFFYTPTDHGGLTLHQQHPGQQRNTMRLVSTGTSTAGYVTVTTCMGRENILDHAEGFRVLFARERGRDPGLYYLRVFGEPGGEAPWGWRFGGHHVSLNNLVVGDEIVSTTPCFVGMDPAAAPLLGGIVSRPLARVEDLARDLVRSLPESLRAEAVLHDTAVPDLVTANRTHLTSGDRYLSLKDPSLWSDVPFADPDQQQNLVQGSDTIDERAGYDEDDHAAVEYTDEPKGVVGGELDADQRQTLRELLTTYFDRVPEGVRRVLDDDVLDAVHVAWAGSLEDGAPSYYRLQGAGLLMEWDNTQRDANHAHSVWREPEHDFGMDVLADHLRRDH